MFKILLFLLVDYYILKELVCQDKYKKIKLKLKHKYARSSNNVNVRNYEKNFDYNTRSVLVLWMDYDLFEVHSPVNPVLISEISSFVNPSEPSFSPMAFSISPIMFFKSSSKLDCKMEDSV